MKKVLLYIAIIISLLTYNLWQYFPKGFFYVGNAMFIMLLSFYLYLKEPKSFITFIIFTLSINNLLDELFFGNTETHIHEILTAMIILIIGLKKYYNDRKGANNI